MKKQNIIRIFSSTPLIIGVLGCLPFQAYAYAPNISAPNTAASSSISEHIYLVAWTVYEDSGKVFIRNGRHGSGTWIEMPDRKTAEKTAKKLNKAEKKAKKKESKNGGNGFIEEDACQSPNAVHTC